MSGQRHPYAGHPAALILADHTALTVARGPGGDRKVRCDCEWEGRDYDHPAHLVEVLVREGLLPEPDTLRVILVGRRETHWGNVTPDGDHLPRGTVTDARRTFKARGWPIIRRVTIEGPWEPTTDWAGLLKEQGT